MSRKLFPKVHVALNSPQRQLAQKNKDSQSLVFMPCFKTKDNEKIKKRLIEVLNITSA